MAKRINISIPDSLHGEIQNFGSLLNISQICQDAIWGEIKSLKNKKSEQKEFVEEIKQVVLSRKELLIGLANDEIPNAKSELLDETDRMHIKLYLEKGGIPEKPRDSKYLMKVYASSCLSFPIVRRQLTRLINQIPTPETISICLDKFFNADVFKTDDAWEPKKLARLIADIQQKKGVTDNDLSSLKTKPRIMAILLDGANLIDGKLKHGLNGFYTEVNEAVEKSSDDLWRFVKRASEPIRHVGPSLFCDFLKNIGFSDFVRISGYFKKEFPELISEKMMTEKRQFIVSLALCKEMGIKPFHFDHIMYQWGRNKTLIPDINTPNIKIKERKVSISMMSRTVQIPESLYKRLGAHVKSFDDTPAKIIERLLDYYENQGNGHDFNNTIEEKTDLT